MSLFRVKSWSQQLLSERGGSHQTADDEPAAYKHPVYNGLNCKLPAGAENKLKTR